MVCSRAARSKDPSSLRHVFAAPPTTSTQTVGAGTVVLFEYVPTESQTLVDPLVQVIGLLSTITSDALNSLAEHPLRSHLVRAPIPLKARAD